MTKTLPISEARKKFTTMVDRANRTLDNYVITRNGRPEAVLISHEEYEGLKETLDILSEPGALEEIRKSEKEIAEGKYVNFDELKAELGME